MLAAAPATSSGPSSSGSQRALVAAVSSVLMPIAVKLSQHCRLGAARPKRVGQLHCSRPALVWWLNTRLAQKPEQSGSSRATI